MIKTLRILAIFSATLFLVVTVGLIIVHASPPPHKPSQQESSANEPNPEKKTEYCETFGQRIVKDPIAFFTFLLVIANSLLAIGAIVQLRFLKQTADAANKSAKIAEDALISGKRAFIFVKQIISNRKSSNDGIDNWDIVIVWKNTGNTPTKDMLCNANSEEFKGNIPDDFNFPDSSKYPLLRAVIGPGGEIIHTIAIPLRHLYINSPPPDRVYVWGWADYNDVFKDTQRHRTEFCFEIEQIGIGNRTTLSFNLHAKYNGADDECYRKPSPYIPPT